jgi:hypothetical protein
MDDPLPSVPIPKAFRVMQGVIAVVFGGAGLCVLGLIWSEESNFVPIFARLFGSLIALAFVAFGAFMGYGALARAKLSIPRIGTSDNPLSPAASAGVAGYTCPNCGAALGERADVSPMGDVKCAHCGRWFNVHQRI